MVSPLIPFEGGRSLTWDVTVVCTTADSYIDLAVQGPGCVAEMAASRKELKYRFPADRGRDPGSYQ